MSDADPRVVWDPLERLDCRPHGELHDFRSACPEHGGDNDTSLHVTLTPDGTILLHCFAYGCKPEDIVGRLGLRMADLFPSDRTYTARLKPARREDFTGNMKMAANVILALERLERRCRVSIDIDECPCCESPHAQLVIPSNDAPYTHCWRECGVEAFTGGLAEKLKERRRGR